MEKRSITVKKIVQVTGESTEKVEKILDVFLATLVSLRDGETLETDLFRIMKFNNAGGFYIDYNPQRMVSELQNLLHTEDVPEHISKTIQNFLKSVKERKDG